MSNREEHQSFGVVRVVIAAVLALVVPVLLVIQLIEGIDSADRTIGVYLEGRGGLLYLDDVVEGGPAAQAGLRVGDIILEAGGREVEDSYQYDDVAGTYVRSQPVVFRVLRDGESFDLRVIPGVTFDWWYYTANALAALLHLAVGVLVLTSRLRGPQARLLAILLAAIALELAMPVDLVGAPELWPVMMAVYWALSGVQFSVELHLAVLIPERQPWVDRHRWVIPFFYLTGLGFGLILAASELPRLAEYPFFAWFYTSAANTLIHFWLMSWPLAVIGILGLTVLRWRTSLGRHQALLILMGMLPWVILTLALNLFDLANRAIPYWMEVAEPSVLILYPVAVFVALYRYNLFDFELVVRRSAIYAVVTTSLVLVFYGALGAAGAFLSTFVEDPRFSVWIIAGATLALGLLFGPLKLLVEKLIERQFFPERDAQRRRLGALAHELPRLGKLPAIGDALVRRISEIFAAEWTSLLLVEGRSGLLVSRASSQMNGEGTLAYPILLSAADPYVEALLSANRSLPLESWRGRSQVAERFLELGAVQVHPIVADKDLVGLLLLGDKEGGLGYSSEEVELLDIVAHHVATVLENAKLFESATTDGLTGLLRRESLLPHLDIELERSIRYQRPLTIALVDMDQFKRINDRLGHLTGDVVLQQVARRFAETLRKTDILGRFGGDEFMVILPETALEGAARVAAQLRDETARLEIRTESGEVVTVTISVGLVSVRELGDEEPPSRTDLIRAADRQLYRAKQAGRNQVAAGAGLLV